MEKYPMIFISDLPNGNIAREYKCFKLSSYEKDGEMIKYKDVKPYSYLIDSKGIIRWIYEGTKEVRPTNDMLREAINNLF